MTAPAPSELQLDALREVANIGCGHAANALSRLVGGKKVELDVPQVSMLRVAELPERLCGAERKVTLAVLGMEGELHGKLLLVLAEEDACRLSGALLGQGTGPMDELRQSALGEAANIVASACLSAMGDLTGLKLLPTVPTLMCDRAGVALPRAITPGDAEEGLLLVLEARFHTAGAPDVSGQLLVLPDRRSLAVLLGRLGV